MLLSYCIQMRLRYISFCVDQKSSRKAIDLFAQHFHGTRKVWKSNKPIHRNPKMFQFFRSSTSPGNSMGPRPKLSRPAVSRPSASFCSTLLNNSVASKLSVEEATTFFLASLGEFTRWRHPCTMQPVLRQRSLPTSSTKKERITTGFADILQKRAFSVTLEVSGTATG